MMAKHEYTGIDRRSPNAATITAAVCPNAPSARRRVSVETFSRRAGPPKLASSNQRVEVLEEVVFPGLELHRIPTEEGRAWLASQQRRLTAMK